MAAVWPQGAALAYEGGYQRIVLEQRTSPFRQIFPNLCALHYQYQNGCTATDEAVALLIPLPWQLLVNGVLSCTQTLLELGWYGLHTGSNYSYQWYAVGLYRR